MKERGLHPSAGGREGRALCTTEETDSKKMLRVLICYLFFRHICFKMIWSERVDIIKVSSVILSVKIIIYLDKKIRNIFSFLVYLLLVSLLWSLGVKL